MSEDKMNKIFSDSLSGIIDEGKRKPTMPAYLEKLAEEECENMKDKDGESWVKIIYEDELENAGEKQKIDEVSDEIPFGKSMGLTRANELNNDESRTVESKKVKAINYKKDIGNAMQDLLSIGHSPKEIEKSLMKKFPRSQVLKYLKGNSISILEKYGEFGVNFFKRLSYDESNSIEGSIRNHKARLKTEDTMKVLSSFHDYLGKLKRLKERTDPENKVSFKRDRDKKEMKERTLENNKSRNTKIAEEKKLDQMLINFKASIKLGLSVKEAHQKLLKGHKPTEVETFYNKFSKEINKYVKFSKREPFDTDFKKVKTEAKVKTVEEFKNRRSAKNDKRMLNYTLRMLSKGKSLKEANSSLKRKFELSEVKDFLQNYDKTLQRHYGQLGYIFIDSNLYSNCDEMKKAQSKLSHDGCQLIYAVKANRNCKSCSSNNCGACTKVNLLISNHPLVRSPRAARRVLKKATAFVPQSHVKKYSEKISVKSNISIISEFALGIKKALEYERGNMGKKASLEKDSLKTQESFVEMEETMGVDIFNNSSSSKIIDDVMKGE